MLSSHQLASLKEQLEELKEELKGTLNQTAMDENERGLKDAVDELSSYDNHPADLGTELFEREKDHAIEDHTANELEKVYHALHAMAVGTYGNCVVCGAEIPYERLEVIPYAVYCIEHTPDRTIATDRPVEEQLLKPASRDSFDRNLSPYVNDGLDTFQEVARYGTSETPADFTGYFEEYGNLYEDRDDHEGFTEEIESFIASDITGEEIIITPSKTHEQYEEMLDDEDIESSIGNIPFHKTDGYEEE